MNSNQYVQWANNIADLIIKDVTVTFGTDPTNYYSKEFLGLWKEFDKKKIAQDKIIFAIYQYYLRKINYLLLNSDYNYAISQLIYFYLNANQIK